MIKTTKTSIPAKRQKDRQTDSAKVPTLPQPRRISKLTKDCHFHRTYGLVAVVVVAHQNTAPLLSTLHKRMVEVGVMVSHGCIHSPAALDQTAHLDYSALRPNTQTHGERDNIRTVGLGAGAVTAVRHGAATNGTHFT